MVLSVRIFGFMTSAGMKALFMGSVLPPMRFEQAACFGPLVSITGTQKHHGGTQCGSGQTLNDRMKSHDT